MKRTVILLILVTLFLVTLGDPVVYSADEEENYLGLGVAFRTRPYEGVDSEIWPFPIISWQKDKFFVKGIRAGYEILERDNVTTSVYIAPRFMGYDSDDATALNGMEDRDWSLDGGLGVEWEIPQAKKLFVNLSFAGDLLGEHKGNEAVLSFSQEYKEDIYVVTPQVGVKWQSNDLVDHYYGVDPSEATASRSAYESEGTTNFFANLAFYLGVHEDWVVVSFFEYEFLGENISDSPIVENSRILRGLLGITRKF